MVESSHGFKPTVPLGIKELTAKLDDIKKSSKVMNIKKFSKHKCAKEMKTAHERDNFISADSAKSFGLIDQVVEKRT